MGPQHEAVEDEQQRAIASAAPGGPQDDRFADDEDDHELEELVQEQPEEGEADVQPTDLETAIPPQLRQAAEVPHSDCWQGASWFLGARVSFSDWVGTASLLQLHRAPKRLQTRRVGEHCTRCEVAVQLGTGEVWCRTRCRL